MNKNKIKNYLQALRMKDEIIITGKYWEINKS